jgi:hypothetical protein
MWASRSSAQYPIPQESHLAMVAKEESNIIMYLVSDGEDIE